MFPSKLWCLIQELLDMYSVLENTFFKVVFLYSLLLFHTIILNEGNGLRNLLKWNLNGIN